MPTPLLHNTHTHTHEPPTTKTIWRICASALGKAAGGGRTASTSPRDRDAPPSSDKGARTQACAVVPHSVSTMGCRGERWLVTCCGAGPPTPLLRALCGRADGGPTWMASAEPTSPSVRDALSCSAQALGFEGREVLFKVARERFRLAHLRARPSPVGHRGSRGLWPGLRRSGPVYFALS